MPKQIETMPPLTDQADYHTVYVDINTKPQIYKQPPGPPRKVYKYIKANWTKVQEEVTNLSDQILLKENQLSTQQMWKKTEIGLQKIINDNVLSKTVKGYKNPTWFNKELKELFPKRNTAYRKWVHTKSHQDEQAFQDLN